MKCKIAFWNKQKKNVKLFFSSEKKNKMLTMDLSSSGINENVLCRMVLSLIAIVGISWVSLFFYANRKSTSILSTEICFLELGLAINIFGLLKLKQYFQPRLSFKWQIHSLSIIIQYSMTFGIRFGYEVLYCACPVHSERSCGDDENVGNNF